MEGRVDQITREAVALTAAFSTGIGPRRPCSPAERRAHQLLAQRLTDAGVDVRLEDFSGVPSFAWPYGAMLGGALVSSLAAEGPGLIGRLGRAASLFIGVTGWVESGLVKTPFTDLMAVRRSQNLVATIEPAGRPIRTVCLMAHADSSRSGLMFDRRFVRALGAFTRVQSAALGVLGATAILRRSRFGRGFLRVARVIVGAGLAILAERELRGQDVPGANDNASGAGVVTAVGRALGGSSLEHTRVVVLVTGCEESGLVGAHHFLRNSDTESWIFINIDGVGARATLRFLPREGLVRSWPADSGLLGLLRELAGSRPDLKLAEQPRNAGLTYDSTPVLARGGRAVTLSAQDEVIPEYHSPSDTVDNIDERVVSGAVEAVLHLLERIDAGAIDRDLPPRSGFRPSARSARSRGSSRRDGWPGP